MRASKSCGDVSALYQKSFRAAVTGLSCSRTHEALGRTGATLQLQLHERKEEDFSSFINLVIYGLECSLVNYLLRWAETQ